MARTSKSEHRKNRPAERSQHGLDRRPLDGQSEHHDDAHRFGYFSGWWRRKGSVVLALVDDVLLYGCFLLFVALIHFLLNFAAAHLGFGDTALHKEIHKWGFLACDITIILGLIRKLFVTLVLGTHG